MSYFEGLKHSAFRLELLSSYTVEQETDALTQFIRGVKSAPPGFNQDWISLVARLTLQKVKMQRVRLLDEPISDYLRFEIGWGYSASVSAGEDIRVIDKTSFGLMKTLVPIVKDFWLFDEEACVFLEYDSVGRFLGLERLPQDFIGPYQQLKQATLEKSRKIQETKYWEAVGND